MCQPLRVAVEGADYQAGWAPDPTGARDPSDKPTRSGEASRHTNLYGHECRSARIHPRGLVHCAVWQCQVELEAFRT